MPQLTGPGVAEEAAAKTQAELQTLAQRSRWDASASLPLVPVSTAPSPPAR